MMPHPEGLRVTPAMARQQMEALKRMQPDQLESLAAMAERGGPPDAQQAAEMLKASTVYPAPASESCAAQYLQAAWRSRCKVRFNIATTQA